MDSHFAKNEWFAFDFSTGLLCLSQPVFCLHPIILLVFALRLVFSQTLLVWDLVTNLGVYHAEIQVISAVN